MATISIPAATHINVVATTFDHSAKSNLGTIRTGSYLSQASMLVYDDILRFQNSTDAPTADISNFNYNQFEGNILWFMDELVGMESDWIKTAAADSTTAYGYVQFTEDSVETAVNRYIGHLERFNERSLTRDWEPYSIKRGETLPTPEWLTTLKNSTKTHEEKLDALIYDEMLALAFVHLHSKKSKDANFVLLAKGDIYASKEIYKNNHHTNPDAATLARMVDFWPWRKQNKYAARQVCAVSATPSSTWIYKCCAGDNLNQQDPNYIPKTAENVINCISAKLVMKSGADLATDFAKEPNVVITDVTSLVQAGGNLGIYTNWHQDLNITIGSGYKVFERTDNNSSPPEIGYFFYRPNGAAEWLQNVKDELNNNPTLYNYDELCQTINNWPVAVHTYIIDWWMWDVATYTKSWCTWCNGRNFLTPQRPAGGGPPEFGLSSGISWYNPNIQTNGIILLAISTQNARGSFGTMFHEGGGHAMHNLIVSWGYGLDPVTNKEILLSPAQNTALLTLYQNYTNTTMINDKILPMSNIRALGLYKDDKAIEEELLSRIYSLMATNKCITFTDDIWPIMKQISPGLSPNIIDLPMARKIDAVMKDDMLLNRRTYNVGP